MVQFYATLSIFVGITLSGKSCDITGTWTIIVLPECSNVNPEERAWPFKNNHLRTDNITTEKPAKIGYIFYGMYIPVSLMWTQVTGHVSLDSPRRSLTESATEILICWMCCTIRDSLIEQWQLSEGKTKYTWLKVDCMYLIHHVKFQKYTRLAHKKIQKER